MLFRIIYPGKTGRHEDLKTAAREVNPTARKDWIGVMYTNDVIEAKVSDVEEGKKLMRHIYRKTGVFPKGYAYVDGDKWWGDRHEGISKFLGTEVYADRYRYSTPVDTEHFEDFLD